MYTNFHFKPFLFLALTIFLGSCDKEYNSIGGDLVDNNNFGLVSQEYPVIAYTQKTGPVQADNLTATALGIYNDANFGETTANFATQVYLPAPGVALGINPVIDSVAVSIPYFIDPTKTTANKETGSYSYKLDSIYGKEAAKMKLSVYESGYAISKLRIVPGVPNNTIIDDNKLFTNQSEFEGKKGALLNEAGKTNFFFKRTEHIVTTLDATNNPVKTRTVPEFELRLNPDFFKTKLFDNPSKIANNEIFTDYFKGLYFKIEKADAEGELALLDIAKGKITIYYKNGPDATRVNQTMLLNFASKVSLLNTQNNATNTAYAALPDVGNKATGDPKLYLKGGEGAMAVISIFNDPKELEALIASKVKINEANLVFNIDTETMKNSDEPNRVYLYDLTNNVPIADYFSDRTKDDNYPKKGKSIYGGALKRIATNGKGISYKINITNHLRNIIQNGAANVKLGLVVTEDINIVTNNVWKTPVKLDVNDLEIPASSVMNPLGTILYGTAIPSSDSNYDKRLKLQIYYTKPN
jgi:hypothetical protein